VWTLEVVFIVFIIVRSFLDASRFDLLYQLTAVVAILNNLQVEPAAGPAGRPVVVRSGSVAEKPVLAGR
jgi:hypothetical protein